MKKILFLILVHLLCISANSQQLADSVYAKTESLILESNTFWENGEYDEALKLNELAIECLNSIANGNNMQSAQVKHLYGLRLKNIQRKQEAINVLQDAYDTWRRVAPTVVTPTECDILNSLVETYIAVNEYEKASKYGELLLIKSRRAYNQTSDEYTDAIFLNARIHMHLHHHAEAKKFFNDYIRTRKNNDTFDDGRLRDIMAYEYSGVCAYENGDFEDAKEKYLIADSLYSKNEKYQKERISLLNKLAIVSSRLGDLQAYNSYLDMAVSLTEEYDDDNEEIWLLNATNKASLLMTEDVQAAADIFIEVVECYKRLGREISQQCASAKANLAYCAYLCGESKVCLDLYAESIATLEELGIPDTDLYYQFKLLQILALMSYGKDETLIEDCQSFSTFLSNRISNVFPKMTEQERGNFWKLVKEWYNMVLPNLVLSKTNKKITQLCYDGILLSKGILLNSSTNIEKMIKASNDESLSALYSQMLYARSQDQQLIAQDLEHRILKQLPMHGDFMSDMSINTDSVRSCLKDNDIAIEFISTENLENDDTIYIALTLRRNYDSPQLTRLCTNKELAELCHNGIWTNLNAPLYNIIWEKLEKELQGVKRIFFAVDGELQRIPIEFCSKGSGPMIFDKYDCFRLSSTRQVVKNKSMFHDNESEVVLYGNINYDASFDELRKANKDIVNNMVYIIEADTVEVENEDWAYIDSVYCDSVTVDEISIDTLYADSVIHEVIPRDRIDHVRGAYNERFELLPATEDEIAGVEAILSQRNKPKTIYNKNDATEESAKALNGRQVGILHFATHGFYMRPTDNDAYTFLITGTQAGTERESLSRSALVLAGANNIFSEDVPADLDDGYLTAYELSTMDLTKTDLVVMSACESGLGDISSEGVFGLQRGFKKAGANSILMSLSTVNDYATMLFMKEFYKSYLSYGDKRRAIKDAQEFIRITEGGKWNQPKYWAPFVLLDGYDNN